MIFRRIRNLWKLSKYTVKDETLYWNGQPIQNDLKLVRDYKPNKKSATIIDTSPKEELFPIPDDSL